MKLSSDSFTNNTTIPLKNSYEGGNISPPLHWSNIPPATQSFAVVMDDPDAASVIGKTFDHWVLYNIPSTTSEIPENLPHDQIIPNIGAQGVTTRGEVGYMGPCPPKGLGNHRYKFHIFALCLAPSLEPCLTKDELYTIIKDHIISEATITGTFSRD